MAAGQTRIDDLLYFNGWLDARQAGDRDLAAVYERPFRPEFVPAFRAWLGQRLFDTDDEHRAGQPEHHDAQRLPERPQGDSREEQGRVARSG